MSKIINSKPWLIGLLQAFLIILFTFAVYFGSAQFFRTTSYTYYQSTLVTIVSGVGFVLVTITYALLAFGFPLYLSVQKRVVDGIKTVVFTALFLSLFVLLAGVCLSVFSKDATRPIIYNPNRPSYSPTKEELINKAQEVKTKAEVEMPTPTAEGNLNLQYDMYPNTIDINTGEETPIDP